MKPKRPAAARPRRARTVRPAPPVPAPAMPAAPAAGAPPDRTGWSVLLGLAFLLLATGQGFLLADRPNLPLGILHSLLAFGLGAWLAGNVSAGIRAEKAVLLVLTTAAYSVGAYQASLATGVQSGTLLLLGSAGLVLFFVVHPPSAPVPGLERRPSPAAPGRRLAGMFLWTVLAALAMAAVIWLAKKYLGPYDLSVVKTDFFHWRTLGGMYDISASPFREWGRLWLPAAYLAFLLGLYAFYLHQGDRVRDGQRVITLFLLGNFGALTIAYLSTHGFGILPIELTSGNYNYYATAHKLWSWPEFYDYLVNYPANMLRAGLHVETHPPGGVMLNWALDHLLRSNAAAIALALGSLTWTAVVPIYWLGRELYNRTVGFYAAALYAVLPNVLIFSYVSLDALIATVIAWTFALVVMGVRRGSGRLMAAGGLTLGLGALLTVSILPFMPALFALAWVLLRDRRIGPLGSGPWLREAARLTGWFLLGGAAVYLAMQGLLGGRFDYLQIVRHAAGLYASPILTRPWSIWFWLSPIQFFIHTGAAVTALFCLRWAGILRGDWRNDPLPWAGFITMAAVFLNASVHNEADRLYLVYSPFVVWTAALVLFRQAGRLNYMVRPGAGADPAAEETGYHGAFLWMTALSYLNAVVIQLLVAEYW